jgi:hypothetical protein
MSFMEWSDPCSDGMVRAVSNRTTCAVACVASIVSFVASVSDDRPCRLTPSVPCQYNLTWGNGASHGVVGAGGRRGPTTPAVDPAPGLTSAQRLGPGRRRRTTRENG